ncbi:Flp family type IVb pilin [Vibrio breoganii]
MLKTFLTRFKNDERGVTAIEYGIIGVALATVLSLVIASGDTGLVGTIKDAFNTMTKAMGGTAP